MAGGKDSNTSGLRRHDAIRSRAAKEALDRYHARPKPCLECGEAILARPSERIGSLQHRKFCRQSCAAKYTNRLHPKRSRRMQVCATCGSRFTEARRRKLCNPCFGAYQRRLASKQKSQVARDDIYGHARSVMRGRVSACEKCGYEKFVEACHIKPVRSFPGDALLSEINAPENLLGLCPNCHWELDHPPR